MKQTVPPFNLHNQNHIRYGHAKPLNIHSQFTFKTKLLPPNLIGYKRFRVENSAAGGKQTRARHLLPGGRWWNLSGGSDEVANTTEEEAKPVTVLIVLRRIWALIGEEKWVAYVAVASLAIAALSEISIPNILAASVFSAQSGETVVFCRNSQLLLFLCLTSGICSGVRSGCFGMANMILVKRLRESLFTALIYQDISFFDSEAVGGLTSRLGADCQRLSHVLGNDIHLILRNALQGIGALINLLTLSWPLALSTLVICSLLSTIFLVYGQYKQWLDKIVFIGIRESLAYGFWHLSFSTLYRSTQVVAVLLGGMSILTGHVTAEQLMKYVLYCEWLIYAAWRVEDNLSSLLQTVGATENVFQLMNLMPSDQFLSKGMKLQRLMGKIEFVNVSFYYPSRLTILVDGFPLRKLDIRWLRDKIGFVGQEPHLLHMDVKSNICYGCSRDIIQEDIEWAAKQAHAHEFISSLPSGYETIVDDCVLSGGQKQRIAIARAIIRDPTILILDEATSALDADNEYYISGVLHAFRNDGRAKRTIIVIAHSLSTVKAADRIMVMNSGRVVEMGNHAELLHKDGLADVDPLRKGLHALTEDGPPTVEQLMEEGERRKLLCKRWIELLGEERAKDLEEEDYKREEELLDLVEEEEIPETEEPVIEFCELPSKQQKAYRKRLRKSTGEKAKMPISMFKRHGNQKTGARMELGRYIFYRFSFLDAESISLEQPGTNDEMAAIPSVVVLTPDNFDEHVLNETKDVLVEFYEPGLMEDTIITSKAQRNSSRLSPSSRIVCRVCQKQFSQYTCPGCNTRYCSLHCYKSHSLRCTESFMRENVVGELQQLQTDDETKRKMLEILERFHSEEEVDSMDEDDSTLSEETMEKILSGLQVDFDDLTAEEKETFTESCCFWRAEQVD
ncbi:hypothetical protein RHSIM_Rhsim10G0016900 [Rhododendron simsii]|uniref:Uncharacterized protein n=1 Tax=Rhododendron simsii TaxID=118357 RepID=A0A834GB61_RHOSS|nr:hypothetical protein RHSIM_Rhsim10G0016900 [Rhododendron simsii]